MTDDFEARMARLGSLLEHVEQAYPPEHLGAVRELVRAVLDVHQSGLAEILDILRSVEGPTSPSVERLLAHPGVASLLQLHDLHPSSIDDHAGRQDRTGLDGAGNLIPAERLYARRSATG